MSNTIYTPITLWEGFKLELPVSECIIEEKEDANGIIFKKVYISGRNTEKGQVAIFGTIAYDKKNKKMPGLLILPNYGKTADENTVKFFAKEGYYALMIDYGGNCCNKSYFTKYPEDIEYANAPLDKDCIHHIDNDVKTTCWYEWVVATRYAYYFLKNNSLISSVGALGRKHGATILWQLAVLEESISCIVAEFSAGWRAYRNYYKFGDNPEPTFTENDYKYLGGIEPQTYAQYIKCPTLMLSCTNNNFFDADRAYDTLSRINEKYYTALNYSVQSDKYLDNDSFNDILVFLRKYLKNEKISLPVQSDLSIEVKDGKLYIKVKYDKTNCQVLKVFSAEETINPKNRCWNISAKLIEETSDYNLYEYLPYNNSKIAFFFAKMTYLNGFTSCSRIVAKKFDSKEIINQNKSNIIYSNRENNSLMSPVLGSEDEFIFSALTSINGIEIKEGPFAIKGITAKNGLISRKINNEKDKPLDNAILMLDIYSAKDNEITVSCIEEIGEEKKCYFVNYMVSGGEVWHNLSFSINKFKTAEGIVLKSYKNVTSIVFKCKEEYLLNNILWI